MPRIYVVKVFYRNCLTKNDWKQMVLPEHKSLALIKYLMREFLKADDFVQDAFMETLSAARAYHFLDQHRRLLGCEELGWRVCICGWACWSVYFHLLDDQCDCKGDQKLVRSTLVYLNGVKYQRLKQLLTRWGALLDAWSVHTFQKNVV